MRAEVLRAIGRRGSHLQFLKREKGSGLSENSSEVEVSEALRVMSRSNKYAMFLSRLFKILENKIQVLKAMTNLTKTLQSYALIPALSDPDSENPDPL